MVRIEPRQVFLRFAPTRTQSMQPPLLRCQSQGDRRIAMLRHDLYRGYTPVEVIRHYRNPGMPGRRGGGMPETPGAEMIVLFRVMELLVDGTQSPLLFHSGMVHRRLPQGPVQPGVFRDARAEGPDRIAPASRYIFIACPAIIPHGKATTGSPGKTRLPDLRAVPGIEPENSAGWKLPLQPVRVRQCKGKKIRKNVLCRNPLVLALLGASPGGSAPAAVASPVRIVPYYLSIKSERLITGNIVES